MPIPERFETDLTKLLGIRYPIMCAGMVSHRRHFDSFPPSVRISDALLTPPTGTPRSCLVTQGHVTGAELASAVSNAGGIGTIGAIGMSPEGLRAEIKKLVAMLEPGDSIAGTLPFGVDLLLPQVGGNARKTNKDYTGGQLEAVGDVASVSRQASATG